MSLMVPRDLMDKYAVGQRHRGRVEFRAEGYGVFVEVARGAGWCVDALVRFDPGPDPGPAGRLRVGDVVEVIVTGIEHRRNGLVATLAPSDLAELGAAADGGGR